LLWLLPVLVPAFPDTAKVMSVFLFGLSSASPLLFFVCDVIVCFVLSFSTTPAL
jgi:hypothetical protein